MQPPSTSKAPGRLGPGLPRDPSPLTFNFQFLAPFFSYAPIWLVWSNTLCQSGALHGSLDAHRKHDVINHASSRQFESLGTLHLLWFQVTLERCCEIARTSSWLSLGCAHILALRMGRSNRLGINTVASVMSWPQEKRWKELPCSFRVATVIVRNRTHLCNISVPVSRHASAASCV